MNHEDKLPNRYLYKLIKQKWSIHEGFVYYNMPYNSNDLRYMMKKDCKPDLLIFVEVCILKYNN